MIHHISVSLLIHIPRASQPACAPGAYPFKGSHLEVGERGDEGRELCEVVLCQREVRHVRQERHLDEGFGFRVSGLWFRVPGFGFRVSGLGFRVSGFGFRVSGSGFRV